MSADAAEMPVNPRMPAMIEITRKIRAHFSSDTVVLQGKQFRGRRRANFRRGNWFPPHGPKSAPAQVAIAVLHLRGGEKGPPC